MIIIKQNYIYNNIKLQLTFLPVQGSEKAISSDDLCASVPMYTCN